VRDGGPGGNHADQRNDTDGHRDVFFEFVHASGFAVDDWVIASWRFTTKSASACAVGFPTERW
jgi:hypothetical protein